MDKINSLTGMPDLIGQKSNESNSSNKIFETEIALIKIFESYSNKGETTIHAKSNVEFFNTDLIGKCDSLYYSSYDSSITLYDEPIIWIDEYQIFSDTISIAFNNPLPLTSFIKGESILKSNDIIFVSWVKHQLTEEQIDLSFGFSFFEPSEQL